MGLPSRSMYLLADRRRLGERGGYSLEVEDIAAYEARTEVLSGLGVNLTLTL